ncbi:MULTISPECIES: PLP-dependent aspartate aminotransferase family protein [unclassified Meiothermus]|uniref:trans-sulfuration enzyme family protein n=1 Tax=unclassified Meiothermus TaxID=370471 RepID=UPI000D7BDC4B|nr:MULTISPECIES: PLP-dependent aspartate aminotransferase family protein [unclassified Meiothermus]PZA07362.1 PLP-dependent transferase [Meiothermus sp. Pnk-1]RYM37356.1 PLP-dependent transferase [Meiothermus sp. PNK-Is4]
MDDLATLAVHAAKAEPPLNEPVSPPIYQSASWTFRDLDEVDAVYEGHRAGTIYGRNGTPNHRALEALFAALHRAESAIACASGMSALSATFLGLLGSGDKVVASQDLYGSTLNVLRDLGRFGVRTATVDLGDVAGMERELQGAKLLVLETASNPRLRVPDLPKLSALAHQAGAVVVVDNTFASPYHCRPLEHGVDLVMESLTKFINGHSDAMLGAVAGKKELVEKIRTVAVRMGLVSNPYECWLAVRGSETLAVRMERASKNALELAQFLEDHPKVRRVHYPGLPSHPDHATARTVLHRGFGAMLSFELEPSRQAVNALLHHLQYIRLALSLGGANTTLSHPATSSHRFLPPQEREALGLHEGFLRMSVGIEHLEDLRADLTQALAAV